MNNKFKLISLSLLAGLFIVSCSLPALLASQIQEYIDQDIPSPSPAGQVLPTKTPEPVEQSTLQTKQILVLDRTVFESQENPRYEVDGRWPNFGGEEVPVKAFNVESDRLIESVHDDFRMAVNDLSDETETAGEPPLSFLTFDYELTYADGYLFSFYLKFDRYIALSAHPFPFSQSLNYDALNAEFLRLEDLFLPGTDYINAIVGRVDPILESRGFGYQAGTAGQVLRQRENWNLFPEGLRINFDVYEVAPYAAGPQTILISWEELAGLMDPSGPAGKMLP